MRARSSLLAASVMVLAACSSLPSGPCWAGLGPGLELGWRVHLGQLRARGSLRSVLDEQFGCRQLGHE